MSSVVDKIPEGWVEKTLGEVVTFQRGFDLPKKDRKEGLFPLLVSNGQDGTHIEYKVKGPGIVTGRSGSLGNVFLSELDFWPLNTTLWIKNFHKNNVKYCYYFLKTFPFERYNSGSGVPTLNRNHIHPILVKIPKDLQEQKAIAQVLTAFDDKIENLRAQNQTLETLAQTIFKEWFLPSRQAGGKYQIGDDLPEGWKYEKLNYIAKHLKKSIKPSKNPEKAYVHYSLPAFDNGLKPIRENGIDIKSNKYAVVSSSFLVSKLNPFTPRIWTIYESEQNHICSTEFQVVKPREDMYFSLIHCFLNSTHFTNVLSQKVKGTSSSHQRVNPKDIFDVKLAIPELQTLNKFNKIVDPMILKKNINHQQIQSLTKTRDTLLPKLMSGELRVEGFGG